MVSAMLTDGQTATSLLRAVVIGGSAGATEAVSAILRALPYDFAAPVFVIVHAPKDVPNLLIDLLASRVALPLVEAEDKSPVAAGNIYIGPADYHLLLEADDRVSLTIDSPVHFSRPSIDVLFESAALVHGAGLIAVLLSGANEDGARGLAAVRDRGGHALVQDPRTAPLKTMPAAAIRLGAVEHVLAIDGIVAYLKNASSCAHAGRAVVPGLRT